MKDGLYQVTTKYFCAGMVIRNDFPIRYAPILARNLAYWKTIAVWICP